LGRRLPESKFRIIQGAGHVVMVDKRDEFNNIIVKFIKENST
jgi:pimeloyl-ACP methyl ester carboxylesterase